MNNGRASHSQGASAQRVHRYMWFHMFVCLGKQRRHGVSALLLRRYTLTVAQTSFCLIFVSSLLMVANATSPQHPTPCPWQTRKMHKAPSPIHFRWQFVSIEPSLAAKMSTVLAGASAIQATRTLAAFGSPSAVVAAKI